MSIMAIVLFIAVIICFVIIARYMYLNSDDIILNIFATIAGTVICVVIAFVIMWGASMVPIGEATNEDYLESTIELVALNDKTILEGSMYGGIFITRGYIDTLPTYAYYYKAENGSIKFGQILAERASIYYILDDSLPRIETYKVVSRGYSLYHFPTKFERTTGVYYKLYIPANAISTEIILDLE